MGGATAQSKKRFDLELNCIPFGEDGKIFGMILLLTNMSHIGDMQRRSMKINSYMHNRIENLANNIAEAFSRGQLSLEFSPPEHDDDTKEVAGELAIVERAVFESIGMIKNYVSEICATLEKIAENNYDFDLRLKYNGDFSKISNSFEMIRKYVSKLASEMQNVSLQVMSGADDMSRAADKFMDSFTGQTDQ